MTRKDLRNMIVKKAIIGDISIPKPKEKGNIFLIGYNMGSVALYKNCTIELYGSGLTQLIKARINISQYIIVRSIFKILAIAINKFDNMNILYPFNLP